ncbi:MAG: histidinol dehydrogenase [Candidatus Omnitrophica bacterium]|nr:histidinol dehydrogenase [Candidatus Omnitrophota bacterium]MBU1128652.1 histidinol dehydrogenase [Candidatus Omnitrophota bacterium]MBU1656793.1 histidinol dehydrogenase [Candidatus Omnitrophota bacterium]MBU1783935.1 histidinol dehydrogenase [Candidatus Omnitrophota bacterium]MBU1852218.1 histidinol dehydrogenase [Candidatus Omnitrophota bacterium]
MKRITVGSEKFKNLVNRHEQGRKRLQKKVAGIIENVKADGDDALIWYTKKFDRVDLTRKDLRVTEAEISGAYQDIKPELVITLKKIIRNINKFYKNQTPRSWTIKHESGIELGEKFGPIEQVGIYVPSGTAPLVSSVYMTVLPAKIAGVKRIVLLSPPNKYRTIDPHILVMANLLKVDEIYKIGGAQAIAALAFGTRTIPKVDKIVGPGNEYVTEAKRQVFGYCDIDMMAGPSEVLIIANHSANVEYIKKDLLAQNEHHKGLAVLVTPSRKIFNAFHSDDSIKGCLIKVKNLEEAVNVSNMIAPEHLQLMVRSPRRLIKNIVNAGAIFLGEYSPVALGDYVAGPSHVLPTGGTARYFSGLNLRSFVKSSHVISYSRKALLDSAGWVRELAELEKLDKHWESIKARCEG